MIRVTIVTVLLLVLAAPATASDDLVPAELGGAPAEIVSRSGGELLFSLDPDDELDAERAADLETLLAAAGQPAESLSVAAAYPADGAVGGWVAAVRVAGAQADVLAALLLAGIRADLDAPVQEDLTIGSRTVVRIDDAGAGGEPQLVLYAHGDTAWLLGGTDDEIAAILELLP